MSEKPDQGSIALGLETSLVAAVLVGIVGGVLEALVLYPVAGLLTFTLGPDLVFVLVNAWLMSRQTDLRTKRGMAIGFICVLITAITSFLVFSELAGIVPRNSGSGSGSGWK